MEEGFSYKGKTLLSRVDPAGKADRIADTVPVIDGTLYLCPSPLYGYGLERLLSRLENTPNSAVLCVEAEPELYDISRERFSETLKQSPKLRLTNLCDAAGLCALIRREWGSRIFRRIHVLRLNGGWQLLPGLDDLADTLQREIALDWGNAMTLSRLGRRYMRNAIRNLALIPKHPSVGALSFGAAPVLALGAGPSLDPALDALELRFGKACRDPNSRRFAIVCVDTCLPALRQRGITPDLVVILESQHWNLEDFIGLSGWDVPAALDLSALPRSSGVLAGGSFLFFTPWTRLRIFQRLQSAGLLPLSIVPLGSVGLNAVAVSMRLTQGAVITAGIDFSFSIESSHARSTPGHLAKLRRQNRFSSLLNAHAAFSGAAFRVTAKNGERVFSNPAMRNYRDLFEKEFSGCSSRLFDLPGSGLPLGIKTLSMEEALRLLAAADQTGKKVNSANNPPSAEKLRDFIHEEIDRLLVLRGYLTGSIPMNYYSLAISVDECDYLWAHFPDYAASSRRPDRAGLESGDSAAVSFLNRLRAEIDPFLALWNAFRQEKKLTTEVNGGLTQHEQNHLF